MLLQKILKIPSFLQKLTTGKNMPVVLLVLFTVAFFSTRLPRLANDVINPDAVLWHTRSEQFAVGIKYKQFEKTYQHYHPGVTLMWIVATSVEIFKQITGVTVYTSDTYMSFDLVAKFSLVLVQFFLTIVVILSLAKLTGFIKSFLVTSIFTFEPFFLGTSRILHLDVLSTLLVFLSLIFLFQNLKKPTFFKSVLVGFFMAMAFLTKSICIGVLFYGIFYSILYLFVTKNKKSIVTVVLPMFVSFTLFTFMFFPALWVDPGYYLFEMIFSEGERVGMRDGHRQVLMGERTNNGGILFYPLAFLIKVSPFMLIGVLSFLFYYVKKRLWKHTEKLKKMSSSFGYYLMVFYLGYFLFMTIASKKIDRYLIMMFPFFAYIAYFGYKKILDSVNDKNLLRYCKIGVSVLAFFFVAVPIFRIFPWYFTYTSPIFISPVHANKIIGQKSFGVGIPDLKRLIIDRYGEKYGGEPNLGFYDTQPMRAVYPNSKIFDVRVYGPKSYDLLVLTMNEDIPDKVWNNVDKYRLDKDYSIYINGLEYWRIYVKETLREDLEDED